MCHRDPVVIRSNSIRKPHLRQGVGEIEHGHKLLLVGLERTVVVSLSAALIPRKLVNIIGHIVK